MGFLPLWTEISRKYMGMDKLSIIMSATDVLRVKSRFVKFVVGEAEGRTPYTWHKPTLGLKYVSNRPYKEFIPPTTLI